MLEIASDGAHRGKGAPFEDIIQQSRLLDSYCKPPAYARFGCLIAQTEGARLKFEHQLFSISTEPLQVT